MSLFVAAPGKALLCGEYAVLTGAPAICTAVERYVRAQIVPSGAGTATSPFVTAAREHARSYAEGIGRATATRAGQEIAINSSELYDSAGQKIGLGSSAAVTVTAVAASLWLEGIDFVAPEVLFDLAEAAHSEAQGESGSGVDVATAIRGGTFRYVRGTQQPVVYGLKIPDTLHVRWVYVGQSASTPRLVKKVRQLKLTDAANYSRLLDDMAAISESFSVALTQGNTPGVIEQTRQYRGAMAELGSRSGADIVSEPHAWLAAAAERIGGAAKPSGAGGGDLSVAFFHDARGAESFAEVVRSRNDFSLLNLGHSAPGLTWESK